MDVTIGLILMFFMFFSPPLYMGYIVYKKGGSFVQAFIKHFLLIIAVSIPGRLLIQQVGLTIYAIVFFLALCLPIIIVQRRKPSIEPLGDSEDKDEAIVDE